MKKFELKKVAMVLVVIILGFQAFAQGRIELAPKGTKVPEAQNVTMNGFSATFSFNSIECEKVSTEKGVFSTISLGNSIPGGNIGEPQVPVNRELIAVPFGATPVVTIKNYTVNEYNLADYGIERIYPQQPSVSKSAKEVKFCYNDAAYATRGYDNRPIAEVTVMGTMRGIQVGALQINALRYDAVANTIRVYNDIEVEVSFENADLELTERTLVNTYSPYFRTVYASLFNNRAINDIYDDHPDLWSVPVRVLVIANRMFESAMQPWLTWKTEKGFYMDVNYTDEIGTTASAIKQFIVNKYNEGLAAGQTPTWVVIIGDKDQVPASQTGSATQKVTDLYYYAVAGGSSDYFGDMFHCRFPCETVQEFQNAINKSLMYEQYTMPDPTYLDNVLLVAGWDSGWNPQVGKPTIQYAMNYYYNAAHGFANVYNFLQQPYNNPYASINTGVNFVNYTAHGGETGWSDPSLSVSDVNTFTNNGKYFLAMGNCCLAADWGYASKCFGEAMLIAENKGAYAYIGSCPYTYWWEDYYFGVGATHTSSAMPTYEESTMGVYDATFRDDFNSVSAIPFVGNVAVCYAHANGYQGSVSDQYYWECYHVLGDGTVCPYHTNPIENTVSHMPTLPIGMSFYTVSADPGSYVGISKDGVLYGVGEIGPDGVADIPIEPITSGGDVKIVVTHPQRQPYVAIVPAAAMTGPYIAVDSFTPTNVPCNELQQMSITFKNVGADATTGTTNVTLSSENNDITFVDNSGSFGPLAADATITLTNEFSFTVAEGVPDNTKIQIDVTATCGSETWTGKANVTVGAPIVSYSGMQWSGSFEPGSTKTVSAVFHNSGHYQATGAVVTATTTNSYATIVDPTFTIGEIGVGEDGVATFEVAVAATCPTTEAIPLTFNLTADNGVTATGEGTMANTCIVVFSLHDSYGDGWNGNMLQVEFSDGTPTENLTISSGYEAEYEMTISISTTVSVSLIQGNYIGEISFEIGYLDGDEIIAVPTGSASAGPVTEFVVNCSNVRYNITAVANPEEAGTVLGARSYMEGSTCTLQAVPGNEYSFISWTRDNEVVSIDPIYSFVVTEDADFVANFGPFQGVIIGEGTATSQYLPSYNYYKYGFSEQIYTADEIGISGTITSVAFYNGGAEKTRSYEMYIAYTNKNSFSATSDWVAVSDADRVFSGSVKMGADEWTAMNLTTPFEYDGTQNIVIVMNDVTGSWTSSPHMECRVFNAQGNQALYAYSDGSAYNPSSPGSGTLGTVKNQLKLEMSGQGTSFLVSVSAVPSDLGTVSGGGIYQEGVECSVVATPQNNGRFVNWTENGNVVSEDATYTFTVEANRVLVAHFDVDNVNEIEEMTIKMYPNPASEKIRIESSEAIRICEVYNINGALVTVMNNCSENFEINVSEFTPGSYIVRLISDTSVQMRRFTKE